MLHHKARGLIVLILTALLLFGGCKEDTSFILPPESTGDQLQSASFDQTESQTATTDAATVPTAETEPSAESVTVPTEVTTAPAEATTEPADTQSKDTEPSEPADTQSRDTEPSAHADTQPKGTKPTEPADTQPKDPKPSEPADTQPKDTKPTEPADTQPKDPEPTEPTDTQPKDPEPTEHKHSYDKVVIAPTCTEEGYTKYTCACGHSYTGSRKDPLDHNYKVTKVQPTTSQRGYDLHECSRCGLSYKDNYTDKLPSSTAPAPTEHQHSYEKTVVNPTCTEKGYTEYACACGDSYSDSKKSALGHDYKTTVVQPTVTEQGYNLHECTRCGDSYKDNYVDKLPAHTEPPETEPPETAPPSNANPVYDISDHVVGSLEYEILAEINARRAEEGLSELKMDKKLCALAAIRAYEASISFSHTRPDGRSCFTVLDDYNYKGGSLAGENLLHASPGYSASRLVDVWMKSTSHKNNILTASFTKAGLGIYYADGRMYIANFFAG